MTPSEFLHLYAQQTNTHQFANVSPLIAENAVFWFSDGSHIGKSAIERAFTTTWNTIQGEIYSLRDLVVLGESSDLAAYQYTFHWQGLIDGKRLEGTGRGTSVITKRNGQWQIIHEHLSNYP
jgi:ketosteroid isomerase-like protein